MCQMHDAFGGICGASHNCLGCNFADVTTWIDKYLAKHATIDDTAEAFTFYLLRLYLFVERAYVIFDIVNLPPEYRGRHFRVFQDVHKWANFIKHPKAFMLVHHPQHWFIGCSGFEKSKYNPVIDQEFVDEYYSANAKEREHKLRTILANQTNVAVLYPDPVPLTEAFCAAMRKVIDLVIKNDVYREILASRTTYENYFARQEAAASSSTSSTTTPQPSAAAAPLFVETRNG
jgi:hypothetical protein